MKGFFSRLFRSRKSVANHDPHASDAINSQTGQPTRARLWRRLKNYYSRKQEVITTSTTLHNECVPRRRSDKYRQELGKQIKRQELAKNRFPDPAPNPPGDQAPRQSYPVSHNKPLPATPDQLSALERPTRRQLTNTAAPSLVPHTSHGLDGISQLDLDVGTVLQLSEPPASSLQVTSEPGPPPRSPPPETSIHSHSEASTLVSEPREGAVSSLNRNGRNPVTGSLASHAVGIGPWVLFDKCMADESARDERMFSPSGDTDRRG